MTSIPSGLSFLQTLAGYAQQLAVADNPSANAPIRLAVIDPSYVPSSYPGTLPRVTFEGEETVTDKRYVVIARDYIPGPSDRVVMLPSGHTYVILGAVSPSFQPNLQRIDLARRVYLEGGPSTINATNTQTETLTTISFGYTFLTAPIVLITQLHSAVSNSYNFRVTTRTTTNFQVAWRKPDNTAFTASITTEIMWLAIGT